MKTIDKSSTSLDIKTKINLSIAVLVIFLIGSTTGYLLGYWRSQRNLFPEIEEIANINPGISTIQLLEVVNGQLKGKIEGTSARIVYGPDHFLELNPKNPFSIPLNQINLTDFLARSQFPNDILFVASNKGKYYYSVLDNRAANIRPKNRLFFQNAALAEAAGFKKTK